MATRTDAGHKQLALLCQVMAKSTDDSLVTRSSLIERLKDWGDQLGWQEFFDRYWRLIYHVALQAGLTEPEAQDAVQETVISVAKKIGEFRSGQQFGSFKAWLLTITRRRIVDQFRKRQRLIERRSHEADEGCNTTALNQIPDRAHLNWDGIWDEQWQENLLEQAVERVKAKVSPKQFLLFLQQTSKDWSASKVARKYGVSLASVYMAKYRISAMIKKEVRKLERQPG